MGRFNDKQRACVQASHSCSAARELDEPDTFHTCIMATANKHLQTAIRAHVRILMHADSVLRNCQGGVCGAPIRSTCCGVAHRAVKVSSGTSPAMGRKLKMPPPPLLTSTTCTLPTSAAGENVKSHQAGPTAGTSSAREFLCVPQGE